MSIVPDNSHVTSLGGEPAHAGIVPTNGHAHHASLHRIGLVRRQQGVSLRTVSRHWNVELAEVRQQQQEDTDLPLSQLYKWQQVLGVPVAELLIEGEDQALSDPVLRRAQLVKIMKTAVTLRETAREVRVQRLVATLVDQLIEIMPELAEVGAWHGSGNRRTLDDYGRAVEYRLSDDLLQD
ncbi:MAG: hypothetical protein K8T91_05695 [Planctomycetes bacterium]|nr:hypothetical protein [Planctomycetota bacterium]